MKNWQSQERDARWYRLNKSGKTQAEIAEEFDTTQSYVCQRIKAHRERHVNEKKKDKFEFTAALKLMLPEEYKAHAFRFDAITEDLFDEPRGMQMAIYDAIHGLGRGFWSNIGNRGVNPHGDFVRAAFQRYAEFDSKFNDLGLRK